MSTNNTSNSTDFTKPSDPITINTSARRARSVSVSSGSSSSAGSSPELQTPTSASVNSHRMSLPSPGSSPILSYFLAQSPAKAPANGTFPFNRKFGPPPVFEDDEMEVPAAAHARRASTTVAGRFAHPQPASLPDPQLERGSGLLRRLSLSSGAFAKPHNEARPAPHSPPPNSAQSPTAKNTPFVHNNNKPRRSATVNEGSRPRRAPSPMGERILKGHFDGFN
ncbi:hypothetical protein D9615_010101 [Tricholomella constricta]|uniref:Uncharacterized protein n=1 Tax=Tricholomella constricta TaxID=117010 RepID=A0A8H5GXR4_9AGAR|nr:hypothetical protein D9615_010101 [Tricholomella constricta]